jgi:nucleoside-diphosphate-sugar epimerase
MSFIQSLEYSLGRQAKVVLDPASPLLLGEQEVMYADTTKLGRELAYSPVWDYEEGLPRFAEWLLEHYGKTFKM